MKKEPQKSWKAVSPISEADYLVPILLIDDNAIDNFINESMLEFFGGFDITVFNSAHLALEHLEITKIEFKYIIVDLKMPVMDGFTFIEYFNNLEFHKQVQLIILSASLNPLDILKAGSLNIKFVEKPLTLEKLLFLKK